MLNTFVYLCLFNNVTWQQIVQSHSFIHFIYVIYVISDCSEHVHILYIDCSWFLRTSKDMLFYIYSWILQTCEALCHLYTFSWVPLIPPDLYRTCLCHYIFICIPECYWTLRTYSWNMRSFLCVKSPHSARPGSGARYCNKLYRKSYTSLSILLSSL